MSSVPVPEAPLAAPQRRGLFNEVFGFLELPRLVLRASDLAAAPRGDGGPVLVLPGYGTGDASTLVIRSFLRSLGHDAVGWGLGRNGGDVAALLPRVVDRLERLADSTGRPVAMVGWSLGGVLAREAAREAPGRARTIVTLGSPVVGGPKYTAVADAYRRRGLDLDAIEAEIEERYGVPLETSVTAVFSRNDGVVAWNACIDRRSPRVEHVEVEATHLGLGFSADVLHIIAERLSSDAGGAAGD
jgi:pimeloyl-ACP methyl ester carboxylesterase